MRAASLARSRWTPTPRSRDLLQGQGIPALISLPGLAKSGPATRVALAIKTQLQAFLGRHL